MAQSVLAVIKGCAMGYIDDFNDYAQGFDVVEEAEKRLDRLWDAVRENRVADALAMIDEGMDAATSARDDGWSLLHQAAADGNVAMIRGLVDRGANINARDNDDFTPLHQAAFMGQSEAAVALIMLGADTTIINSQNRTAVDEAVDGPAKHAAQTAQLMREAIALKQGGRVKRLAVSRKSPKRL